VVCVSSGRAYKLIGWNVGFHCITGLGLLSLIPPRAAY